MIQCIFEQSYVIMLSAFLLGYLCSLLLNVFMEEEMEDKNEIDDVENLTKNIENIFELMDKNPQLCDILLKELIKVNNNDINSNNINSNSVEINSNCMNVPLSISQLNPTECSLNESTGYFYWGKDIYLVMNEEKNEYFVYRYTSPSTCESFTFPSLDDAINRLKLFIKMPLTDEEVYQIMIKGEY